MVQHVTVTCSDAAPALKRSPQRYRIHIRYRVLSYVELQFSFLLNTLPEKKKLSTEINGVRLDTGTH